MSLLDESIDPALLIIPPSTETISGQASYLELQMASPDLVEIWKEQIRAYIRRFDSPYFFLMPNRLVGSSRIGASVDSFCWATTSSIEIAGEDYLNPAVEIVESRNRDIEPTHSFTVSVFVRSVSTRIPGLLDNVPGE